MFKSLISRAKSAWTRVVAWFRRRFGETPAVRGDGAGEAVAPMAMPELAHEPPTEPAVMVEPTIAPPRWLEGAASSPKGRIPWVLTPPERSYRLYIPANDEGVGQRPLLVMIHGCRQDAETFATATRMNALADEHGFAVLYPDQSDMANLHRCWNWFETETLAKRGEVAILLEMIDRAVKRSAADPENVAIAGLSSGGALAALLAYSHPDRFSSVAVHSGLAPHAADTVTRALAVMRDGAEINIAALTQRYWHDHQLPPPPLLVIHGDADDRVHSKNADQLFDLWASLNQAEANDPLPRKQQVFNATTTRRAYRVESITAPESIPDRHDANDAQGFKLVESVRVNGLQHAWSGGDATLPFNDAMGPDASKLIVAFARLGTQLVVAANPELKLQEQRAPQA
jgi:poly(hydroxyalkanoate) depolymerase family esterase